MDSPEPHFYQSPKTWLERLVESKWATSAVSYLLCFMIVEIAPTIYHRLGRGVIVFIAVEGAPWAILLFMMLISAIKHYDRKKGWEASVKDMNFKYDRSIPGETADTSIFEDLARIAFFALGLLPFIGISVLENALLSRSKLLRGMNVRFRFIWLFVTLVLIYRLELMGTPRLAFALSILLITSVAEFILLSFSSYDGTLAMFLTRNVDLSPRQIIGQAITLLTAFSCLHFHNSHSNPAAYNRLLTIEDSIYFSTTTLATVGYGDIYPVSSAAKWTCIAEIALGMALLILSVSVTMAVWIGKNQAKVSEEQPATQENSSEAET